MNTLIQSLVLASLVLAAPGGQAQPTPTHLDIGISPHLAAPTAGIAYSNIARLLISLPAGVEFRCGNAESPGLLVRGLVPKLPFASPAAQAKALSPELKTLRTWLQANRSASPLAGTGCLNLPRYLRWVGENRLDPTSGVVLLVGDVFYRNPAEPGFDFATNRLPALENLGLTEARSPWGCLDRRSLAAGLSVHWWFPKDTMPHEPYAVAAREFFSTYLTCQGASGLGQFTADWATATASNALFKPLPAPRTVDLAHLAGPNPQPRMKVVSAREVAEPAVALPKVPVPVVPAPAAPKPVVQSDPPPAIVPPPPATNAPVAPPPVAIPQEVNRAVSSVGILWAADASDLDISLRSKPGTPAAADELFYGTPSLTNALGRYLADHRSGGQYEWIQLSQGMEAASLGSTREVWVNHFAGSGPVELTVAILDHGQVVATRKLTITGHGDHRRNAATRESSTSWAKLPIAEMLQPLACRN